MNNKNINKNVLYNMKRWTILLYMILKTLLKIVHNSGINNYVYNITEHNQISVSNFLEQLILHTLADIAFLCVFRAKS